MNIILGDFEMALKDLLSKTNTWLRSRKLSGSENYQPDIDDNGLIRQQSPSPDPNNDKFLHTGAEKNPVVVKTVQPMDKSESLEKLQEGFNNLIGQLKGINEHLNHQISQHEDLMNRIEQLPKLLESFPTVVENQKKLTEQMLEQLKSTVAKDQQFIDVVAKIPTETGKQTDALVDINNQLAAAADADVQMAESFNKFTDTLDKLDRSTTGQTDGILQMSKTFATSDRYLKYLMSRQNKRFMWIFMTAIGVCVVAILILTGIIIYLKQ
jgi:archaellum component FlaC